MIRRILALAAASALLVGPACAPVARPAARAQGLKPMSGAERETMLPVTFPIEVPVPKGKVLRSSERESELGGVWLYDMETTLPPEETAAWFRAAYGSRGWRVARDEAEGERARLVLQKGSGAESVLLMSPSGSGTFVEASIGLGVAVSQVD